MANGKEIRHQEFFEDGIKQKLIAFMNDLSQSVLKEQAELINQMKAQAKGANIKLTGEGIRDQEALNRAIQDSKVQIDKLKQANKNLEAEIRRLSNTRRRNNRSLSETDRLQRRINAAVEAARPANIRLARSLRNVREENRRLINSDRRMIGFVGRLTRAVAGYAAAWLSVQAAVGIIRNVFETTKQLDSLKFAFEAVITDADQLASTQQFLLNLSRDFGQELVSLSENYLRFRAAVKQTNISILESNQIFESIVKTSSILGLSAKRTELALLAIEQIASKGTVSLEELRRQLGDQIPGATQIMADALETNVAELFKMIKANEVLAEDALPKFARQLEFAFSLENINRVETLQASTGRLKTEWQEFVRSLEASDTFSRVIDVFAKAFRGLSDSLKDVDEKLLSETFPEARKDAEDFVEILTKGAGDATKELENYIRLQSNIGVGAFENAEAWEKHNQNVEDASRLLEIYREVGDGLSEDQAAELITERIKETQEEIDNLNITIAEHDEKVEDIREEYKDYDGLLKTYIADKKIENLEDREAIENARERLAYLSNYITILKQSVKSQEDLNEEEDATVGIINRLNEQLKKIQENLNAATSPVEIAKFRREIESLEKLLKFFTEGTDFTVGDIKIPKVTIEDIDFEFEDDEEFEQIEARFDNISQIRERFGLDEKKRRQQEKADIDKAYKDLGLSDKEYNRVRVLAWVEANQDIIEALGNLKDEVQNAISEFLVLATDRAERELEIEERKLDKLKSNVDEEYKKKQEGLANDYDILVSQEANQRKIRDRAFNNYKETKKKEIKLNTLMQASNIILSSTNIFRDQTEKLGLVGVLTAAAGIAAMIALFFGYKNQMEALDSELPAFKDGTEYVNGPGTSTSDSINARLSKGERVVPAKVNERLRGIPNDKLPELLDVYNLNMPRIIGVNGVHDNMSYEIYREAKNQSKSINKLVDFHLNKEAKVLYETNKHVVLQVGTQIHQILKP